MPRSPTGCIHSAEHENKTAVRAEQSGGANRNDRMHSVHRRARSRSKHVLLRGISIRDTSYRCRVVRQAVSTLQSTKTRQPSERNSQEEQTGTTECTPYTEEQDRGANTYFCGESVSATRAIDAA